MIRKNFDVM